MRVITIEEHITSMEIIEDAKKYQQNNTNDKKKSFFGENSFI